MLHLYLSAGSADHALGTNTMLRKRNGSSHNIAIWLYSARQEHWIIFGLRRNSYTSVIRDQPSADARIYC